MIYHDKRLQAASGAKLHVNVERIVVRFGIELGNLEGYTLALLLAKTLVMLQIMLSDCPPQSADDNVVHVFPVSTTATSQIS
jgi:hypothetical protein